MVAELLEIVEAWIGGVFGWISYAFTGVLEIFYDETGFTVLGSLLLLGLALSLVFFALRYIRSLIAR